MKETFYQAITDFVFVSDAPEKADVIMVPGSNSPDTVLMAAKLYKEGYAPYVLPAGCYAKMTGHFTSPSPEVDPQYRQRFCRVHGLSDREAAEPFYRTEWEYMRDILLDEGVPEEAILREDRSTFTWENAIFSKEVLLKAGIRFDKVLLCCKSFHARRALTYYQQQFTDSDFIVASVDVFGISADNWFMDEEKTRVVLGELARMGMQFQCMLPTGRENRLLSPEMCIPADQPKQP